MRRIVRNLFVVALVPAMMQSGMAQWTPHICADMTQDNGVSSTHADAEHEDLASGLPGANTETPPEEAHDSHCHHPSIGCDCPDCINYFDAHSYSLPTIGVTPPQVPEPSTYNSGTIILSVDLDFAPPTPPPRS